MQNFWGIHCLFDCGGCDPASIRDKDQIKKFLKDLVNQIQMVAYGDPMIEYIDTKESDKSGITFLQMIETSSIVGHFVDASDDAYIDVFSCKEYDERIVEDIIKKYFAPERIKISKNLRQA